MGGVSLTSTQSILILGLGVALLIAIVVLCYFSWFFCCCGKGNGVLAKQATFSEDENDPSDVGTMAVQYDDIYLNTPNEDGASDLEEGIEFTEDNPALYLEMPRSYSVKDMEIIW